MDATAHAEDSFVDEAPPPPPPKPRNQAKPPANGNGDRMTRAQREMRDDEEGDLRAWLDGLVGDAPIQVAIMRKRPLVGPNGENVSGTLETVEEKVDENYVEEMWGGGTFELRVKKQGPTGSFNFFKSRTIKIAGEPKMRGIALVPGGGPVTGDTAVVGGGFTGKAMDMAERMAERERQRADRIEREATKGGGFDFAALQALQAPLIAQLEAAQEKIASLQMEVLSIVKAPPPRDDFRDKMLERAVDGDGKRIETLRETYENRLAQQRDLYEGRIDKLQDNHRDELKRLDDRHRDDLRRMEDSHDREIKALERSSDKDGANTKQSYDARIDSLKETIGRLERELTAAHTKIATLEAKKDQTIGEKADELIKVKEALDGIGGGGDDDADKPWYERLVGAIGEAPAVLDLVGKIGGATGAAPANDPGLPPVGQPFYGPDGGVYIRTPQNQIVPFQPQQALPKAGKRKRKAMAQAAAQAMAGATEVDDDLETEAGDEAEPGVEIAPPVKPPKPAEVKMAVAFMENAVKSGADPAVFARSAQSAVPGELLRYIHSIGPEEFLAKVRLETGSPLATQNGRNFVRKVFKHLFEGGED